MANISRFTVNNHTLFGTLLVVVSGLLYGTIGYFGMQLFYEGFSVPAMLFWRFFIAALWIVLFAIITRRSMKTFSGKVKTMVRLAAIGALSYSGGSAFFYLASLDIGTGPAMVIFFSFPVFVTFFSVMLKHSTLNRYVVMALVMVVTGMIMLNGSGDYNLDNRGIVLALTAAFSYAIYVFSSQNSSKLADSLWMTLLICIGCSSIFLCFASLDGTMQMPHSRTAWVNILVLGILATAIPIQLLLNGLKYISSVKASMLSVLEAVMTVVLGVTFLNETLEGMQVLGILVILLGGLVIQFEKQPDYKAKTPLK